MMPDVKSAIEAGDAAALSRILKENRSLANELVVWGANCHIATHPLHYVSDMLFEGRLKRGLELPLIDALLDAGAGVDFQKPSGETALIGAASLGAEEVGIRLLERGASPHPTGLFGETALHWAAMIGAARLVSRLIEKGSPIGLKDAKYHATPLGWAIHGWRNPPAGAKHDGHYKVVEHLVTAGAAVDPAWLDGCDDPKMRAALTKA